jgi:hypothetical protein
MESSESAHVTRKPRGNAGAGLVVEEAARRVLARFDPAATFECKFVDRRWEIDINLTRPELAVGEVPPYVRSLFDAFRRAGVKRTRVRGKVYQPRDLAQAYSDSGSQVWHARRTAHLLRWAAGLLPADQRARFVEETCGNLAATRSRREWVGHLAGQLLQMPKTAWVYRNGRRREPTR